MKRSICDIEPNGDKFWILEDELHNAYGPAYEGSDGFNEWFLYGQEYSFDAWADKLNLSDEQIVMYKLEFS